MTPSVTRTRVLVNLTQSIIPSYGEVAFVTVEHISGFWWTANRFDFCVLLTGDFKYELLWKSAGYRS